MNPALDSRARFEALAMDRGYSVVRHWVTGEYLDGEPRFGWEAWQAARASSAAAQPDMPETWHVVAHVAGEPILSIGYNWVSGKGELSDAETQAVIGMAQHLLAFVGYGLPESSFDPGDTGEAP